MFAVYISWHAVVSATAKQEQQTDREGSWFHSDFWNDPFSPIVIGCIICVIYLLLFHLLWTAKRSSAVSLCSLLVSAFSFSSTSRTNASTSTFISQKQMFTTQRNRLHVCFNSIAKEKKINPGTQHPTFPY